LTPLLTASYTRDPDQHFIPLQANLARNDSLNEYIQHTASAIFAIPPGSPDGGYIGQTLFEG
jgi:deferrochelatase/peroxidase EfeB